MAGGTGSDLLVGKKGVETFTGAPLFNDAARDLDDLAGGDWVAFGIDTGLVGLDVLGIALDPFGQLFGEVAGYIIEHVGFLNTFMDALTGDPQGIEAASETWKNIAERLVESAREYEQSLGPLAGSWQDAASDAYVAAAEGYIACLQGAAGYAELFSEGITLAGMLCAKTRQDVYDAIGDFLFDLVMEGLAALAAAGFTFGGSLAAWITAMEIQADLVAASIADKIAALLGRMGKFAAKFAEDAPRFAKVAQDLAEKAETMQTAARDLRSAAEDMKVNSGPAPGGANEDNPLTHVHHGADVGVRGGRDEHTSHQGGEETGGE
jgi:PPE family